MKKTLRSAHDSWVVTGDERFWQRTFFMDNANTKLFEYLIEMQSLLLKEVFPNSYKVQDFIA